MNRRPINHCYWVLPNRLLAGEYPRNLEEESSREKIGALIAGGVRAFIDLTEADEGLQPYSQLLAPYLADGVSHQRFPVRDASVPATRATTAAILDAIDLQLQQQRTVYVHCWGGVGRTGTIVGCWLARHGEVGDAALRRLRELWRACPKSALSSSPETLEQERYVLAWDEKNRSTR